MKDYEIKDYLTSLINYELQHCCTSLRMSFLSQVKHVERGNSFSVSLADIYDKNLHAFTNTLNIAKHLEDRKMIHIITDEYNDFRFADKEQYYSYKTK